MRAFRAAQTCQNFKSFSGYGMQIVYDRQKLSMVMSYCIVLFKVEKLWMFGLWYQWNETSLIALLM